MPRAIFRILAFGFATGAWAAPIFDVQAVGPAGASSGATAISASGAVAGNYRLPDGSYRAFVWKDGGITTLPLPQGAAQTWAAAISGSGQAGGYVDDAYNPSGVVWDNTNGVSDLGSGFVMGLNSAGDAAGLKIAADGSGRAFMTRNGQEIDLGQPAGGDWSTANAINNAGAVAGSAMNSSGAFQAFSATADGKVTLLSSLGGANSYAKAINDAGFVAGHSQIATGASQATLWAGGLALALGTLGGANSYGYAIDSYGRVAGYSELASGGSAAFLFQDGVMYDLNSLLDAGSSWHLLAAYGINDTGQIVGKGLFDGVEQAFLLTPREPFGILQPGDIAAVPEPSVILLTLPALLAIALLSWSRKP